MKARTLLPLLVALPLTAQADITESALRGTRVKVKPQPNSLVNHAHAVLSQGRVPMHNAITIEGGVFSWGYKGTAHEALIDLLEPGNHVPSYFTDSLKTEPSAYGLSLIHI